MVPRGRRQLVLALLFLAGALPGLASASSGGNQTKVAKTADRECASTECALLPAILEAYGDRGVEVKLRGHRTGRRGRRQRSRLERRMLFVGSDPCPVARSLKRRRIFCYAVEAFHGLGGGGKGKAKDGVRQCKDLGRSAPGKRQRPHEVLHVAGLQERLPFGVNHFGVGYAAFVLEHLPLHRIPKALVEWKRVVSRGMALAIRSFEGEHAPVDDGGEGKAKGGKSLPPAIVKTQSWWEGVFEDAGLLIDKGRAEKFEKAVASMRATRNLTGSPWLDLKVGKVFFLKKKRAEFDTPRDFDADDIVESTSEFNARGTYREYGHGGKRSEFDAREVHRSSAVERVKAHRVNRRRARSVPSDARREAERANLESSNAGNTPFSHEYWSNFNSNVGGESHQAFHAQSKEASHLRPGQVPEAREDLARLEAEEQNLDRYLKLTETKVGEARKSARQGRRKRSRRRRKSKNKAFGKLKNELGQVVRERDAMATEVRHRDAEIANSESEVVTTYRERRASHLSRADFIRQEQARLMSRNKRSASQRHRRSLPLGLKEGSVTTAAQG